LFKIKPEKTMELDPSQVIKYVRDKNRQIQNEKSINQRQHYPSTNNNMPLNTLNPRQPKRELKK
jgi:hypothetical protein